MRRFFLIIFTFLYCSNVHAYTVYEIGQDIGKINPSYFVVAPGCVVNTVTIWLPKTTTAAYGAIPLPCGGFEAINTPSNLLQTNPGIVSGSNCGYTSSLNCAVVKYVPVPLPPPIESVGMVGNFSYPVFNILGPKNQYTDAFNFFFSCSVWIVMISLPMKWVFKIISRF